MPVFVLGNVLKATIELPSNPAFDRKIFFAESTCIGTSVASEELTDSPRAIDINYEARDNGHGEQ